MNKQNLGSEHGMPAKPINNEEPGGTSKPNGSEMPTKESVTTTVHESKHFPFQIIEIITTNNNTKKETQQYKVGVGGAFMSEKVFKTFETAQEYISSRPWELITNLICYTIQNALEYEKSRSKR